MSFPCLELGGGGFFLGVGVITAEGSKSFSSSSSAWDKSSEVRGVSCCTIGGAEGSCKGSNIDCRDIDEASVELFVSTGWVVCGV
jgi:hypothetical protein